MFTDFFAQCNNDHKLVSSSLKELYGINKYSTNIFYGLNLIWPDYDLDHSYEKYFLSWHTEQLDTHWLIKQAKAVYPKPILVANDGMVENSGVWPNNIQFVRWVTIHKQLKKAISIFGKQNNITKPTFKLSSLAFRYSQYKKFVTAYLLQHFNNNDIMLTWHNYHGKIEDLHDHPHGFGHLEDLDFEILEQVHKINFDDNYQLKDNNPVGNASWNNQAYNDALVNLTNESFHYSNTMFGYLPFRYPGPYITEKTFKPLLAGRPFVMIGQCRSLQMLEEFGFNTNFGWNTEYDSDCGDLTRIGKIFSTLNEINSTPLDDLFEQSLPAVQHNLLHVDSDDFIDICEAINGNSKQVIQDFING